MRRGESARRGFAARAWACAAVILGTVGGWASGGERGAGPGDGPRIAEGRALFAKEWTHGRTGPGGGDGLGPLYNESSCVGCHSLGAPGGAGPNLKNVVLLNASRPDPDTRARMDTPDGTDAGTLRDIHPGLRDSPSVVLHRFGVDPEYAPWRLEVERLNLARTPVGVVTLTRTQRNTPALFGDGLIDRISDAVLLAAAGRRPPEFPEIKGRVARTTDGRVGRFGWKGQTATLREFVLGACANELGLEVPGHHQPTLGPTPSGGVALDLDEAQCDALIAYVGSLPAPVGWQGGGSSALRGKVLFARIGCAACHTPRLGPVGGIYSDLLLHDMGEQASDSGIGYGGGSSPSPREAEIASGPDGPATATEWRTPPLWGVRASAPYLHDGRAPTLDQAIRLHGGEAEATAARYGRLPVWDQRAVVLFLRSLTGTARRKT